MIKLRLNEFKRNKLNFYFNDRCFISMMEFGLLDCLTSSIPLHPIRLTRNF